MNEPLIKVKYIEWQASIFGACGIALGLGVYFADYLEKYVMALVLAGILLHGWGMWRMHVRNK